MPLLLGQDRSTNHENKIFVCFHIYIFLFLLFNLDNGIFSVFLGIWYFFGYMVYDI